MCDRNTIIGLAGLVCAFTGALGLAKATGANPGLILAIIAAAAWVLLVVFGRNQTTRPVADSDGVEASTRSGQSDG